MSLSEEQFYLLWQRFAESNIITELPDDVEKFCEENKITVSYYIQEFLWHFGNWHKTDLGAKLHALQ